MKDASIDSEMLIVCRKIAASLIRLKRQIRELADDVSQIRDKVMNGGDEKDENM